MDAGATPMPQRHERCATRCRATALATVNAIALLLSTLLAMPALAQPAQQIDRSMEQAALEQRRSRLREVHREWRVAPARERRRRFTIPAPHPEANVPARPEAHDGELTVERARGGN
jgi:hypothetical protein